VNQVYSFCLLGCPLQAQVQLGLPLLLLQEILLFEVRVAVALSRCLVDQGLAPSPGHLTPGREQDLALEVLGLVVGHVTVGTGADREAGLGIKEGVLQVAGEVFLQKGVPQKEALLEEVLPEEEDQDQQEEVLQEEDPLPEDQDLVAGLVLLTSMVTDSMWLI